MTERASRKRRGADPTVLAEGALSEKDRILRETGRRVRQRRETAGLTRKALSEATGISPRFIAQLESGQGNISLGNLNDVARALEVPLATLLSSDEDIPAGSRSQPLRAEVNRLLDRARPEHLARVLEMLREPEGVAIERPQAVITLTGLRGAGKSTIGPIAAQALGLPYRELDDIIQERTGLAVPEIFELHGEGYYRQAERESLEALIQEGDPVLISVSGGIVDDPDSFRLLCQNTLTVWLKATPELHMKRVQSQGDNRPMRNRPNAMVELRQLLASRDPLYRQADIVIDTTNRSPSRCAVDLASSLRNHRIAARSGDPGTGGVGA